MISIIVPIYNVSNYLGECLQSIKRQTYKDFEVLCVDDGSTDNSADIVRRFAEDDKRIKLYQQSNSGVSVARNLGLKHSQGEFICFVDADDMIASDYLSVMYKFCKGGDFAVCSYTKKDTQLGKKQIKCSKYDVRTFISNIIDESIEHPNLWAMMFKSEVIKSNNLGFYPGCVRNEDTEFYMKYLVHEEGAVIVTDYKGYYYRDNPNSAMHITRPNAFTSFEASERIERYLASNGIKLAYNKMLYGSIQAYSVGLAREKNKVLYKMLHELYDVRYVMHTLIKHSRLLRRIVAVIYVILGKRFFYKLFSLMGK